MSARVVVVLGHGREAVQAELAARFDARVTTALQPEQRGTGDAARCGADTLPEHAGLFLIFNGDAPLLSARALRHADRKSHAATWRRWHC